MANFSKENYKRPQNTTIEKNPTVTNLKVPQAWEIKE